MPAIQRLDPGLVDKIAAGEVIERPASVVKELVENALDAGATRIGVEIEEGGRKLIRVVDDGTGMAADDLPLAVESHATSKIATLEDLFGVRTLGFRGEALASIAAVSHVRIVSRPRGADAGASIDVRAGKRGPVRAAGAAEGTLVDVRNLFANIPVRRKFLRSVSVEYSHIAEGLTRFALAFPRVRFELQHDGRREFALPPAEDARPRIAHFFGEELARALLVVSSSTNDGPATGGSEANVRFRAWVAPPAFSRPSLKGQYIFLNGRYIRDRVLGHAIGEAYRELLMGGRHPVAFLYLDVPAGEVDVNVHPTKIEVRFRRHWPLHDRIVSALRETLVGADLMPAVRPLERPAGGGFDPARVQGAIVDFFTRRGAAAPELPLSPSGEPSTASDPGRIPLGLPAARSESGETEGPSAQAGAGGRDGSFPRRRFQVHGSYVIEEAPDGIVIVDQHALHERVNLEKLRRQWERAAIVRQRLLIPAVIELPPHDLTRLEDARAALESFGIEWEDFGTNTVAVRTVPEFLKDADPARVLKDFLEFYESEFERPQHAKSSDAGPSSRLGAGAEAAAGLVDGILHFLACRSSIKAGDALGPEEIDALLADRERLENAFTCAHGRPVALKLTLGDLERYFKRK